MQFDKTNININDEVLVVQAQRGDSSAMNTLIIKYQGRIYNAILRICVDVEDASELTQDTFVKVMQNLEKFEARSSFYTWIFRIAVNLTITYCKKNVRLDLRSIDAGNFQGDGQVRLKEILNDGRTLEPARIVEDKEILEFIKKAIIKLDEDQRAVLILRDIEGMNYAQIAQSLDVELGTVKSRLSRARVNLREFLEAVLL